jgi:hypothetical protein
MTAKQAKFFVHCAACDLLDNYSNAYFNECIDELSEKDIQKIVKECDKLSKKLAKSLGFESLGGGGTKEYLKVIKEFKI